MDEKSQTSKVNTNADAESSDREYTISSSRVSSARIKHSSVFTHLKRDFPGWRRRFHRTTIAAVAGIVVVSALVGYGAGRFGADHAVSDGVITTALGSQKQIVTSESQLIGSIARTVGPSVVSVNVTSTSQNNGSFFGYGLPQSEQSAGTGIILTSSGLIITNRHVVPDGTTSVSVTLSDGTELKDVSVVGRTSSSSSLDVAFLKINNAEGKRLLPAQLGDSSKVQVGDDVVAIGNALGQFQNTVTSGIISGYGRSVQA
ncbi:MAG: S1C family serine protease, partial [Candidatus Micrarchaeaceae archaeon]